MITNELISEIKSKINDNHKQAITGGILQGVLVDMVKSLCEVYPQTYTDEEKAQARANIDALSNHNGEIAKEKLSLEVQAILNDVANKQNISDATLATIAKTIVGAINEVYKGGLEDASIATSKIEDGAITEPKLDTDLINVITSAVQPAELASAIATALASYVAKADIVDTTGSATDKVMSQHGVTEAIDGVTNKVTELESEVNTKTDSGILFNRSIPASEMIWLPINANSGKYLRLHSVSGNYSVYFYASDKETNLGSATIPIVGEATYSIIPDNAAWVRIFAGTETTMSMLQGNYISNASDWLRENEVSAIGFTEYNIPLGKTIYYHISLVVGKKYYIKHSDGASISARVGSIASVDASQPLTFIQGKAEFTAREGDEFIKIFNNSAGTMVEIYGEEKEATLQYDRDYSATERVVTNMDDVVDIAWEYGNIDENGEDFESNIRIRTPFLKGGILISNRDYLSIGFKVYRYNMRTMAFVDYTTYNYFHNIYLPEGYLYRLTAQYYSDADITTFDLLKVTWYNVMKDSLVQDFSFTKMRMGAGETIIFDLPLTESREYEVNALTEDTTISVRFLDAEDNVILGPFTPSYADNTNGDAKITFIAPNGLMKIKVYNNNALGGFSLTSKGSTLHRLNNIDTEMLPLPAHWQKHIERKMAEIKNYDVTCGRYGDSFIFVTDIHAEYNYLHSPALIRHIIRNSSVGKVVCGGDIINGFGTEGDANGLLHYDLWMKPMAFTKQIMVRGNHDNLALVNGSKVSANGYYGLFLKPIENIYNKERQIYYHFDNEVQKIRYIVLDTADNEGPATDVAYSQQIEWMKNVIAEKGADWTIVVFTHIFYTGEFTDNDISKPILSSYAKPLTDALDEVNRNPSLPLVACVICGHSHNDIITYTDTAIPCISTTCDAAYTSASLYDIQNPKRERGTSTEQAFDVFYIDTLGHTIHTVRIGAGTNRDFNYPSK